MKQINKYIKGIAGVSLLAFLLFSCTKFDEYSSKNPSLSAPTVTVAVSSVADSSVTVAASSNMHGYISVFVLAGSDTNTYNKVDLLTNNISQDNVVSHYSGEVEADQAISLVFGVTAQNSSYKILGVANNEEGNTGNVAEATFVTDDSYAPVADLESVSPGVSSEAAQALDFAVTIPFDEPVLLADATLIEFGYWDYVSETMTWEAVSADLIEVSGSNVTISQPITPATGQRVYLTVGDGAITDIVGNEWAGVASGYNDTDGNFGLFWRTAKDFAVIDTITPGLGTAVADSNDFVVTVTFDREIVDFYNFSDDIFDDESVVFTYVFTDGSTSSYAVTEGDITIDGSANVLIAQPIVPAPGDKVYLKIGEGAFRDMNYVPNEAFEEVAGDDDGWLISKGLTISAIIGDYTAFCTSYWGGDYEYTLTIELNDTVTDGVTIRGLFDSQEPIIGVFTDGVLGVIEFEANQAFGDLLGDGSGVFLDGGYGDLATAFEGSIEVNGDIVVSWGGIIIGGANHGYWYDYYPGSVWTKQVAPPKAVDNNRGLIDYTKRSMKF